MANSKLAPLFLTVVVLSFFFSQYYMQRNSVELIYIGSPFQDVLPYFVEIPRTYVFPAVYEQVTTNCSYPIKGFSVTVAINMTADPQQFLSNVTGETNEVSVWAGQYGVYNNDVEWGLVCHSYDAQIYAFLQIGDGNMTLLGSTKAFLRVADGLPYTYNFTLSRHDNMERLTVQSASVSVTLEKYNPYPSLAEYGVIMKSHRVNDVNLDYQGNMTVINLDLYA